MRHGNCFARLLSFGLILSILSFASMPSWSQAESEGEDDERLDVTDLERRYWTPRDTEFQVVQNRQYSKVNRLGVSLSGGSIITDAYVDSFDKSLALNYFPHERWGLELNYTAYDGEASKAIVDAFAVETGAIPDHNLPQSSFGASFNWVPLYAKMSFLEKRILYFDMYISPGIFLINYDQQIENSTMSKSEVGFSLDVSQVIFLNRNFAFRLDFKNRWYKNEVRKYKLTGQPGLHPVASSPVISSSSLLFGFTYLFGGGER